MRFLFLAILAALAPLARPAHAQCISTGFQTTTGVVGPNRFGLFFDLTTTRQLSVAGLDVHTASPPTVMASVEIWTTPSSYAGNENTALPWTLVAVDDGTAASQGVGTPTPVTFTAPWNVGIGTVGVAVVFTRAPPLLHFAGTVGSVFNDSIVSLEAGSFAGPPFSPNAVVIPDYVFSGTLCYTVLGGLGVNYCGPAAMNSAGMSARISAEGDLAVAVDGLLLVVDRLPIQSFGLLLSSRAEGFVVGPGGSEGNLCLGGAIGRHVALIANSGGAGTITFRPSLAQLPTPSGAVGALPGETWHFQAWYRDANPTWTSNFTDGVRVVLE